MGSFPPPQLSLDLRPTFVPKSIIDFLYEVSTIANSSNKLSRLDDFPKRLDEEIRKIDAFRRELPLFPTATTTTSNGGESSASQGTQESDNVYADTFSKPVSGSEEAQQSSWFWTFTIATYKPYFDVDTVDVLERIKDSLFPFRGTFTEKLLTALTCVWC